MSASATGFGRALKRLREAAGLTQEQLAARAGMHKFGVAKLEQELREPAWATVQALAAALGTNCLAFAEAVEVSAPSARPEAKPGRPRKAPATRGAKKAPKKAADEGVAGQRRPKPSGEKPKKGRKPKGK